MNPRGGRGDGRLLTFAVGGALYALPIEAVAEVTEVGRVAAVPTLSRRVAGVMNHHGDALPVLERAALLPVEGELAPPRHLLVLADGPADVGRFGLPVDCIEGLVDGPAAAALGDDPVAERRPIEGRLVSVLDPRRLFARAVEVVERSGGQDVPPDATHGGEP